MKEFCILNKIVSDELIRSGQNIDALTDFLKANYPELNDDEITNIFKHLKKRFLSQFRRKWQDSMRKYERFIKKNDKWLKGFYSKYIT